MKEYWTARELADEKLPLVPHSESGVIKHAATQGWDAEPANWRARDGRGGGREYHYRVLPTPAKIVFLSKHLDLASGEPETGGEITEQISDGTESARGASERDARLVIVNGFLRFAAHQRLNETTLIGMFATKYNAGRFNVEGWVRDTVPTISKASLKRWKLTVQRGEAHKLAVDRSKSRKGTGVLDTANNGEVKAFALALVAHQPHLSAANVRKLCRDEFGDQITILKKGLKTVSKMPPVRTFQHFLKALKADNSIALVKLTNPDQFRSTLKLAGTGSLKHITEPNALWQIDASPVDALCLDGRHSLYCCVDIATRRMIMTVSRTPRASAVMSMLRKAILAWGVPDTIKTDNGSDFVARDTKRLFAAIGIEMDLSDAYSPEQKGHVERAIRTFQHEVGPLLPGFVGHSVRDRDAIESRKSFAARLGESDQDTFGVQLTGGDVQRYMDEWLEFTYQHRGHNGLNGRTPFEYASSSTTIKRTVGERALDLLLMPVAGKDGYRTATKFGIRISHHHYLNAAVMPGQKVFVRTDPEDMGIAYLFNEDGGAFLGEAVCAELAGINPQQFVSEQKAMQAELIAEATKGIKSRMREIAKGPALIERVLRQDKADAPNVVELPKPQVEHTTPQIAAADEAMGGPQAPEERSADVLFLPSMKHQPRVAEVHKLQPAETQWDRYRRALSIAERIAGSEDISDRDRRWLDGYQSSAEYSSLEQIVADFPEIDVSSMM
ncbi:MAG: DDE-type integrase/transposase/recombinase [Pseudomonadota bacterium]